MASNRKKGAAPAVSLMGKWTPQAAEEVLLAKIRVAVQDAIQTHRNEKHQDGEARPISFMEFVEELDAKDAFTARLMEILVKEYSERRAKSTPVERQLLIASRTVQALGAIRGDAKIYDNRRPARLPRTRFPSLFRRQAMMDEDGGFSPVGHGEGSLTPISATRDQLFQNALSELEDGEFGAHWNSSLNEVYAEEDNPGRWQRTEPIHPILHDVDMTGWHVATEHDDFGIGAVRSTSPSSFESELDTLTQNQDALSRLRTRVGALTANAPDSRLAPPRLPLVRRHSLRRGRFGRSSTVLDTDPSLRRRLTRGIGEDVDDSIDRLHEDLLTRISGPGWRSSSRINSDPISGNLESLRTASTSSAATLRRLWGGYPIEDAPSGSTLQGFRRRERTMRHLLEPTGRASSSSIPYAPSRQPLSSLSLGTTTNAEPRPPGELPTPQETDTLGGAWGMGDGGWGSPTPVVDPSNTEPAIPSGLSNVRVRWTEQLVAFPVTSEAAEHQSVSAYPELSSVTVGDAPDLESSTLPQPDPPR
ncbi:hypothetical protein M408DRAFT_26066 [Serendipita vermifera MAFF 305830]|uniref:Uncharacterized protein n=1 Tax=Serendipita vermifera MAFF 305830 TaxID=933852 RepID=A0A0C3ALP8_SERVB|nr:hypothetical protein M408DRAFT_26066 [Serendipita vermifera MAFF 305830]